MHGGKALLCVALVCTFSLASNNPQYRVVRYSTDDERIYSESLQPKKEDDDLARRGIAERLSRERAERSSLTHSRKRAGVWPAIFALNHPPTTCIQFEANKGNVVPLDQSGLSCVL